MAQVEVLLQELEGLPHAERVKRMIELGRSSLTEQSAGAMLQALQSQQGVFPQSMACYASYGTRDGGFCREILRCSGSKTLKGLAMAVLLDIIPDGHVSQVLLPLATNPAHAGRLLHALHRLRKQGRLTATAHIVHAVACATDPSAKVSGAAGDGVPEITQIDLQHKSEAQLGLLAKLLPFGNTQQVSLMLKSLMDKCDLRLVAQYHAQPVMDAICALKPSERSKHLMACVDALLLHMPEQVYELFESLPTDHLDQRLAGRLFARFPERMTEHLMRMRVDDDAQRLQPLLNRATAVQEQQKQQKKHDSPAAGLLERQVSAASTASSWAMVSSEPDGLKSETDQVVPKTDAMMEGTLSVETDAGAKAGVPEQTVYSMLACKPVYDTYVRRSRSADLKKLPIQVLLQACLFGCCRLSKALASLPVAQRSEFFEAWKSWWKQQHTLLDDLERSLASNGNQSAAASHVVRMRDRLLEEACGIWGAKDAQKLLPADCLADIAAMLLSQRKSTSDTVMDTVLFSLEFIWQHIPAHAQLKLLQDNPDLWSTGTPLWNHVCQFDNMLPAALHAELLLSRPNIKSARDSHALLAAQPPYQGVMSVMLTGFHKHWAAGCQAAFSMTKDAAAATAATTGSTDPQLQRLQKTPGAVQQQLLAGLLEALRGSEAVQALLERTCRTEVNALLACESQLQCLQMRPATLEALFKHWQSAMAFTTQDVQRMCGPTLAALAGSSTTSPQYMLYEAAKTTLQVMEDHELYAPWLMKLGDVQYHHRAAYPSHVHPNEHGNCKGASKDERVLMWALAPASRQALVLHAATRATTLCPGVVNDIAAASHLGCGLMLQQLVNRPKHILQGWTSEGVNQLLDMLPCLLHQVPWVLTYLNTTDMLQQLQRWHAGRQQFEQCMMHVIRGQPAAAAATGAADSTTWKQGPVPSAVKNLLPSAQKLLAIESDPVLHALMGSEQLLPRLIAAAGQGSRGTVAQTVFDMVKPVIWHEWQNNESNVRMLLLPPAERAVLARARIMDATSHHKGSQQLLFDKVKHLLPYLPFSEIMDHPCFKMKLQAREVEYRVQALEFLIHAVSQNPDLLQPVLQLLHVRRREQDDTRVRVVRALMSVLTNMTQLAERASVQAFAAQRVELVAKEHVMRTVYKNHPDIAALTQDASQQYLAAIQENNLNEAKPDDSWKLEALKSNLPGLAQLVSDSLASQDLSSTSADLLACMVLMLLPSQPEWATQQLASLMSHKGLQAVTTEDLSNAIEQHLEELQEQADTIVKHVERVFDGADNPPACGASALSSTQRPVKNAAIYKNSAATACSTKRHSRGRRRRADVEFNNTRTRNMMSQNSRPRTLPTDPKPRERRWLQEIWLKGFMHQSMPALLQALSSRQDALASMLQLLKMIHNQTAGLLQSKKSATEGTKNVDMMKSLQSGMQQLICTTSILSPIASLPHPGALPTCTTTESAQLIAWYADKVLQYNPDQYPKLLHLVFPSDAQYAAVLKPHLLNTLQTSLPKDRFDLLLLFLMRNKHLPEVATAAVTFLFKYHHDKVDETLPKLLAADPSYIMLPRVFWYCVRHHQQLIPALDVVPHDVSGSSTTSAAQSHAPGPLFLKGTSGCTMRTGIKDGSGIRKRTCVIKFNYSGWSKQGLQTSLWLGIPQLSLRTTYKLSTSLQTSISNVLLAAFNSKGQLDVHVARKLAKRLASLPALPATCLLGLVKTVSSPATEPKPKAGTDPTPQQPAEPGQAQSTADSHSEAAAQPASISGSAMAAAAATGAAATGRAGADNASGNATDVRHQALQDVVLASLVQLDNMSQAWDSLVDALRTGGSSTALAAISALLAADIRTLTGTEATASGSLDVAGPKPTQSGAVHELLKKLRQLPWTRAAVMCQVIKLLGQLAHKSTAALDELLAIADYAAAGLKRFNMAGQSGDATSKAATPPTAAAAAGSTAAAASEAGHSKGGLKTSLPLPAGGYCHRSPHIQLLITLQAFYGDARVRSAFITATQAEDGEIARAAAFIPDEPMQRDAPAVTTTCVDVFTALIKHPDQQVRLEAMGTWSRSAAFIPLEQAMSFVQQVTTWINAAREPADDAMPEEKSRLAHEAEEAKKALQHWFTRLV